MELAVTIEPVASILDGRVNYESPAEIGGARLEGSVLVTQSLNIYPRDTRYTITTGSVTMEFADASHALAAALSVSPRARVKIYNPADDGSRALIWTGMVVDAAPNPSRQTVRLKLRDFTETLAAGTIPAASAQAAREPVGHIDWLAPLAESILGYDIFAETRADGQVQVYRPAEDAPLLETLQRVLGYLSPARRYYLDGAGGRVTVRSLTPRRTGITLADADDRRRWMDGWSLDDGRKQVWNLIRYEYNDGANGKEERTYIAAPGDTQRAPASRRKFGTRELKLDLTHLGREAAREVADSVLYQTLYPRLRLRLRVPEFPALALNDIVTLDYIGQHDTTAGLALGGEWAVREMGIDTDRQTHALELVKLLHFDARGG